MARPDLVSLRRAVQRAFPALDDPDAAIAGGRVLVDGLVKTNPATQVRATARLALDDAAGGTLRGRTKLQSALDRFPVAPSGAVALDAGAAAGGFTDALLAAGAARVYAVDVGHGQLLGRLRQDPRVVVLERTNIADLDAERVPDPVDVVTLDLSYLALAAALPQLDRIRLAPGARLVALVKPMFELRLATAPTGGAALDEALARARDGAVAAGWAVEDWMHSPQRGSRGAAELFLFARRADR
jgi:23S rRNA (cytidine1920-2'-O)/16S rRNA (cytidine1409-2'-O)-methyltransferase